MRLSVWGPSGVLIEVMTSVRDDSLTMEEIQRLVGRSDPVILEIGSHDGSQTNAFLEAFPKARVFAFEPDPRAISSWKRSVTSTRASLTEIALGAHNGSAKFFASDGVRPDQADNQHCVERGWDQSGSLREPKTHLKFWPWVKFQRTIDVEVQTLDGWAAENGIRRVNFIWADVQGAEGDVIKGGLQTLRETRYLYTEYSNYEWYSGQITLREMMDLLEESFDLASLFDYDALFKNRNL